MRSYAYHEGTGPRTRILNLLRSLFRVGPLERALRQRTMGADPGSFWARMIPPEYTYPIGSRRSVEWNGSRLKLDLSNANDHGAYFALRTTVDDALLDHVKPGDTVIDIGGNIGIYALTLGQRVKHGKVITFEPDPRNYARLTENIALNPGLNIVSRPLGIGPEEATHRLYHVVESNSGMNRIVTAVDLENRFPFTEVKVAPLSVALRDMPVDRVDVIKIDVEGFECAVLRGSEDVIRRYRPVLFIEVDDDNLKENGDAARTLVAQVEAFGYRVLDGATGKPIPPDMDLAHCQLDILCLPKG